MARLRANHLDSPHPSRFAPAHPRFAAVLAAHATALSAGVPSYRDPVSGYQVFTAGFLAARITCCDSGCRHCPFVGADPAD